MVSPLISSNELSHALVTDAPPVLLDVRWSLGGSPGVDEYRRGHIPHAAFVDLDRELAAPPGPGRHPLPEPGDFERAMRSHGVSNSRAVVVYDAGGGTFAARGWWLLRYFGHPSVRLLDGGFAGWVGSGGQVAVGDEPAPREGDFEAHPGHMPVLDAKGAAAVARTGALLDARAAERFRGEQEPVDRVAGHIPGARNLPTAGHLDSDGHFLDRQRLQSRFAAAGAVRAAPLAAYCGSGVTAAHTVLAAELAGLDAALYPGSWSEWITDPIRPVATGSED